MAGHNRVREGDAPRGGRLSHGDEGRPEPIEAVRECDEGIG
jgi:hypothetical protein